MEERMKEKLKTIIILLLPIWVIACANAENSNANTTSAINPDQQSVNADMAESNIVFTGSDTMTGVTGNLTFRTTGTNGSTITWISSDPAVLANDGTVTRPATSAGNVTVTLTATFVKGSVTQTATYTVTVLENVPSAAPTGLTAASGVVNKQVTLSWTASAGAISYNVYRSTSPGVIAAPANLAASGVTSPYADNGLTLGTDYYYIVTPAGAGGEGPASAEVMIYPYFSPLKTYQTVATATGDDGTWQAGRPVALTGPTADAVYTGDYITTDSALNLVWKSCTEGSSGATCGTGTLTANDLAGATTTCSALNTANTGAGYAGRTNWRLPTLNELLTLRNLSVTYAATFTTNFPLTASGGYWSSTPAMYIAGRTWGVKFSDGAVSPFINTNTAFVRCVANGP